MSDCCRFSSEQNQEEIWAKFYSNFHKILIVGEGDFSFSASLANAFGSASNIIATSLDSKKVLRKVYGKAIGNIKELERKGCKVMHGVDATAIASNPCLNGLKFDRIVFNFPFAVDSNSGLKNGRCPHKILVSKFLENAKKMIENNGEIHITHRTDGDYGAWRIKFIASQLGLELVEAVDFRMTDYPGYNAKCGLGVASDDDFNCSPSKTYKFRCPCPPLKILDDGSILRKHKEDSSKKLLKSIWLEKKETRSTSPSNSCANHFSEVVAEEKWVKHYSSSHKILLVGEGDFSFASSLATAFGSASNMTATSLDSKKVLKRVYSKAIDNIEELNKNRCKVLHSVDATALASHPSLKGSTFDRIVFNFPYAGTLVNDSRESNICKNQALVSGFLENAKKIVSEVGEIHITHRIDGDYGAWRIKFLASQQGLELVENVEFSATDYSGYNPKWGIGGDINFEWFPSKTYKFRHSCSPSKIFPVTNSKPTSAVDDVPVFHSGEGTSNSNASDDAVVESTTPLKSGVENDSSTQNKDSKLSTKRSKSIWLEKKETFSQNDLATMKPERISVDNVSVLPNIDILQCDDAIGCTLPLKLGVEKDNSTCEKGSKLSKKLSKSIWLEKKENTSSRNYCANQFLNQRDTGEEKKKGVVTDLSTTEPARKNVDSVAVFSNAIVENNSTSCSEDLKVSAKLSKLIWVEKKEIASSSDYSTDHYLKKNDAGQENVKGLVENLATKKPASNKVDDIPVSQKAQCGEGASRSLKHDENDNARQKKDSKISAKRLKSIWLEKEAITSPSSIDYSTDRYLKQNDQGHAAADLATTKPESNVVDDVPISPNVNILQCRESAPSSSSSDAAVPCKSSVENDNTTCKKDSKISRKQLKSSWVVKKEIASTKPASIVVDDVPISPNANALQCGESASSSSSSDAAVGHTAPFELGVKNDSTTHSSDTEIATKLLKSIVLDEKENNPSNNSGARHSSEQNDVGQENVKDVVVENLEHNDVGKDNVKEVVVEEKWVKHYCSSHKILLVGEGDFSFSASLATAFSSASNMIATSLNRKKVLKKDYNKAIHNIQELTEKGCRVIHCVDATTIASNQHLKALTFDRIIFNFPFAVISENDSPQSKLRQNKNLVREFLENAKKMIGENGEIHITHRIDGDYGSWEITFIAYQLELVLVEAVDFSVSDYPGYCPKSGNGGDNDFDWFPSKTYKFRQATHPKPTSSSFISFPSFPTIAASDFDATAPQMQQLINLPEHSNEYCYNLFGNELNFYPSTYPISMNFPIGEDLTNFVYTAPYNHNFLPKSEYFTNLNLNRNEEQRAIKTGEIAEEKWIKHYSSHQKMLLVGEGDFSFSASLAVAFGSASNMIATSLDSEVFLLTNYCKAFLHLKELKTRGCKVIHGVDATAMTYHPSLIGSTFDRIIFNFPYAGFFKDIPRTSQLSYHKALIYKFIENAKQMIGENGEIHITHKTNGFHQDWNIAALGLHHGLDLAIVDFNVSDYPGYSNKYGFGGDNSFNCSPCQTYMFRLPRNNVHHHHMPWPLV